jgi:adenylate cyclase class IV
MSAKPMPFGIDNTENSKQLKKCRLHHTKKLFELTITLVKGFGNFGEYIKKKSAKDKRIEEKERNDATRRIAIELKLRKSN